MQNPRKTAFKALLKMDSDEGYSNIVIDSALENSDMEKRDKALCSAIFYGVLEKRITLDHIIKKYSKTPLKKLSENVLTALRMGLYQIFFMNKIPQSAAVDQSVKLVKGTKDGRFSGFVNGVLRNAARDGQKALYCDGDAADKASVKYSVPKELYLFLEKSYGTDIAKSYLEGCMDRPPLSVKVNTLKISANELAERFEGQGIKVEKSPLCENVLLLEKAGDISSLKEFSDGLFHIEDVACALCCEALFPEEGDRILDACAAPGGKSFTLAELTNDKVEIISADIYEHKTKLIKDGAKRLRIRSIRTVINNAEVYNEHLGEFDRILCDVPCSGLGIIRKKPEIRYKSDTNLDVLPQIQYNILTSCSKNLKKGGVMVYSTCTLNPAENGENADRFLREHKDFEPLAIFKDIERSIDEPENQMTLFTGKHPCDGFFISAFKKVR